VRDRGRGFVARMARYTRGVPGETLRKYLLLALFIGAVPSCSDPAEEPVRFAGVAMGTSWSVSLVAPPGVPPLERLDGEIGRRIEALEQSMSTYRPDSELSRFSETRGDDWFPVSFELCEVVATALEIGKKTGGALDVTVGPLVDLWGFGPPGRVPAVPTASQVDAARQMTGLEFLQADCGQPALRKSNPVLRLDLSSIAKGYAVDEVSELLERRGITHYLVEIGGEVRARGRHPAGRPWSVGIERSAPDSRSVATVLPVVERAVATSGDYRNWFELDGKRYSHTIDPRSGSPIAHDIAAVTVVARTAMVADAYATALLVLGPEDGPAMAETLGLAALFQGADGTLAATPAFAREIEPSLSAPAHR
jgi:FAD:protein FMN transferase